MAFERLCLDAVKFDVARKHGLKIEPWFQYGTMWCDRIDEDVACTVQKSIINFIQSENVIDGFDFRDTSVSKSLLRATETEPWDQWCFDL